LGEEKTTKCNFLSPRQQPISNAFSLKSYVVFQSRKNIFSFLKRARLIIVAGTLWKVGESCEL
jgi:hypothetical protein